MYVSPIRSLSCSPICSLSAPLPAHLFLPIRPPIRSPVYCQLTYPLTYPLTYLLTCSLTVLGVWNLSSTTVSGKMHTSTMDVSLDDGTFILNQGEKNEVSCWAPVR